MNKARTCEKGFAFIHLLQTKAHLAYVMTWGLMSFYNREIGSIDLVRMIG